LTVTGMAELSEGYSLGNRFRLVARLGRGGMAEVWRAEDLETGDAVALKILHGELAREQGYIDLLAAEFETTRDLVHPNIVRVYSLHHEDGYHFLAMEFVAGPSLKSLRGGNWRQIVQMVLPLTDALEYAHRSGVIHRDIKPGNVLTDANGAPRLTDFGVASVLNAAAEQQVRTGGSLPVMSPQQLARQQPAVSDDVYAFGSMLYDILSGAPLFAPNISEAKVREVSPPPLATLKADSDIPAELDRLVSAMLDKNPERRPPGMGAVRAALENLLAENPADAEALDAEGDDDAIRPVTRRAAARDAGPQSFKSRPLAAGAARSGPGRRLYAVLALMGAILLAVVFVLPGVVESQRQKKPEIAVPQPAEQVVTAQPDTAETSPTAEEQGNRDLADEALADVLQLTDRLQSLGIDAWGGADWQAARAVVGEGDDAYKARLYGVATEAYRRGFLLMQPLEGRATEVLGGALADGQAALEDGNQLLALDRFDLALRIDADNPQAAKGRLRAMQLDKVLALVDEATRFETAKDWPKALQSYAAAIDVDPEWSAALEGRDRVNALIAGNVYQASMSQGYSALNQKNYAAAGSAFNAALRARPGDAAAQAALKQLEAERRLAEILRLSREADDFKARENWTAAIGSYERILKLDSTVISAAAGLEQSRKRLELDNRLQDVIANPDRLADEDVWQAASQLLAYARTVEPAGDTLGAQTAELNRLLQRAKTPVAVRFRSDNQTDVVIYKVGKLGRFQEKSIDLKPGTYTAVGVRSGYRDVRRNFRVAPEAETPSIVIACEDPI
jgi:hypothetical protein